MQVTALNGAWSTQRTASQSPAVPQATLRRKRACGQSAVRNSATLDPVKDAVKGASKRAKLGSSDLDVSSKTSPGPDHSLCELNLCSSAAENDLKFHQEMSLSGLQARP